MTVSLGVLVVLVILVLAVGFFLGQLLSRRQATSLPSPLPETIARLEAVQSQLMPTLAALRESVGEVRGRLDDTSQRQQALESTLLAIQEKLVTLQNNEEETRRRQQDMAAILSRLENASQHQQTIVSSLQNLHNVLTDAQSRLAALQRGEEETQRRQQEMTETLSRLEAVVAGVRSRGLAGERILKAVLEALPPDYKVVGQKINGREVELAFRLPNGKCIPIDSKWIAAQELERLATCTDDAERDKLVREIERALERKVDEVASYLDPELTIGIGIAAVPEAVYQSVERVHAHALQRGVVIIAYSMAVPYLLTLLQLCIRFLPRSDLDPARLNALIHQLSQALMQVDNELNGRFSRALTLLQNSRNDLQRHIADAQGALTRLSQSTSALLGEENALLPPPTSSSSPELPA